MINEALQWTTIAILAAYVAKHYRITIRMAKVIEEKTESLNRTCTYLLELYKQLRRTL